MLDRMRGCIRGGQGGRIDGRGRGWSGGRLPGLGLALGRGCLIVVDDHGVEIRLVVVGEVDLNAFNVFRAEAKVAGLGLARFAGLFLEAGSGPRRPRSVVLLVRIRGGIEADDGGGGVAAGTGGVVGFAEVGGEQGKEGGDLVGGEEVAEVAAVDVVELEEGVGVDGGVRRADGAGGPAVEGAGAMVGEDGVERGVQFGAVDEDVVDDELEELVAGEAGLLAQNAAGKHGGDEKSAIVGIGVDGEEGGELSVVGVDGAEGLGQGEGKVDGNARCSGTFGGARVPRGASAFFGFGRGGVFGGIREELIRVRVR